MWTKAEVIAFAKYASKPRTNSLERGSQVRTLTEEQTAAVARLALSKVGKA